MDDQTFRLLLENIKELKSEISELKKEIQGLQSFKWKATGAFTVVSAITSGVVSILFKFKS